MNRRDGPAHPGRRRAVISARYGGAMVPRVFHQIWINPARPALPDEFAAYRDTWLHHHPHWEYRLWNLDNLDFVPRRQELLKQPLSYAQLADVLRYEILLRHGGVYIDTDFECFKPIDALLSGVSAFACSENGLVLTNALLGGAAAHPVFERLVDGLPRELGRAPPNIETGPYFLTRIVLGGGFTPGFALLPSHDFYPYQKGEPPVTARNCGTAYAAHHWAHSWAAPKRRSGWRRLLPI